MERPTSGLILSETARIPRICTFTETVLRSKEAQDPCKFSWLDVCIDSGFLAISATGGPPGWPKRTSATFACMGNHMKVGSCGDNVVHSCSQAPSRTRREFLSAMDGGWVSRGWANSVEGTPPVLSYSVIASWAAEFKTASSLALGVFITDMLLSNFVLRTERVYRNIVGVFGHYVSSF